MTTTPAPAARNPRVPFPPVPERRRQLLAARKEGALIVRMGLMSYLLSVGIPMPEPTIRITSADLLAHLEGRLS